MVGFGWRFPAKKGDPWAAPKPRQPRNDGGGDAPEPIADGEGGAQDEAAVTMAHYADAPDVISGAEIGRASCRERV